MEWQLVTAGCCVGRTHVTGASLKESVLNTESSHLNEVLGWWSRQTESH